MKKYGSKKAPAPSIPHAGGRDQLEQAQAIDSTGNGAHERDNTLRVLLAASDSPDTHDLANSLDKTPSLHCRVTLATDPADAFSLLAGTTFDVVLLDMSLVGTPHCAPFAAWLEYTPRVPIVLLSTPEQEALAYQTLQEGAYTYIIKGHVSPYLLDHTIRAVVEQRRNHERFSHLAAIVESSEDAILGKTMEGIVVSWNASAEQLYGYTADEIIGRPVSILMPGKRKDDFPAIMERIGRGERIAHYETLRVTKDGRELHISLSVSPIRDTSGRITGASAIARDITARKQLEQTVREQTVQIEAESTLLNSIVDEVPIGLVVYDRKMRILHMSSEFARMAHFDPTTSIGRVLYDMSPSTLDRRVLHERVLAGESIDEQNVPYRFPNELQTSFSDIRYRPLRSVQGEVIGILATVVDVTERHELERRKDSFLSLASHELRTPVTIVKGYAQMALAGALKVGDERQIRALRGINTQAGHLTRLITDLLDVSRIESGNLPLTREHFELSELVQEVVTDLELTTPDMRCRINMSLQPARVSADRHLIHEVIMNLVENGVKYSVNDCHLEIGLRCEGGEAIVSVQDNGVGIPAEEQPRIFDRFYRASNAGSKPHNGMGLGLYIARGILERHGGRIWLESAPHAGSTFYFSLSLA